MGEASLIRTVHFSAGHHYRREEWTDEENRRIFGDSAEAHGHDWAVEITVRGPIDDRTGFVVDLDVLDGRLRRLVEGLHRQNLNEAIPEVRDGMMIPSTESLARWFWERLAPQVPGAARLVRIRVAESDTLAAEYEG